MSTTQSSSSSGGSSAKKESPKSTSSSESKSTSTSSSGGEGGKSARESIGGSKDVHYGYFSSVRTPEYRSGWDAIWGKKSKKKSPAKAKRAKGPVELDLEFDKLPPELRDGLMEHARKKLRRTPAGFKKSQENGDVEWTLSVRLER